MSVLALMRDFDSSPSSPWKSHMVLHEARRVIQVWAPQMKRLRLGPVPGLLCVRLVTMLLLGIIFLPSIYCDMESIYYSSYEIVIPKSLSVEGHEDPVGKASYMLFMQGQKQVIRLKVKRNYSVSNFPIYSYHNGILGQETPSISQDCHYEGYIEGVPGSFVSVNTCLGLRGILIKEDTSYGIKPMLSSKQFEHVLYTMAHQARVSCGVTSQDRPVSTSQQQGSRNPLQLQALSYLWSRTKYVEMFVIVNNQRFQMWGSNINETVQRVVDIIALANVFTRGINTEVVLAGMEIWTEGDLIEVPVDLQVTLRNFNSWRQEKLSHRVRHDVAHMIVGHHPGETMGQAFLNGACSGSFAAAVESFHHEDILLFAALMVHELGHNLGIQHDHAACICKDKHFCLMHENITRESGFSNCSSDDFYHFLHEHKGACLFNKPRHRSRKRETASCGNGVIEEAEQCDCGDQCETNECCTDECKLKEGAECSNEACCSGCKFQTAGRTCRSVIGACDLPEYCNGSSALCPGDRYKQDGTVCRQMYLCLSGVCMDPSVQCSDIFGSDSVSAPADCYKSINSRGDRFGNCGRPTDENNNYVKCSEENMYCGKLICTGVSALPEIKEDYTLIQVPNGDDWCWSMNAYKGTDTVDDGDVRNNTYCAEKKDCQGTVCTDAIESTFECKPEENCNSKGVCNDLGNCHCDFGFEPPDCVKEGGNGGSVDSGPVGESEGENPPGEGDGGGGGQNQTGSRKDEGGLDVTLLAFIILILIILVVILVCCFLMSESSKAKPAPPPPAAEPAPAAEAPPAEAPPPEGEAPAEPAPEGEAPPEGGEEPPPEPPPE
ncbi:disintegrin and metalloproteinase domain-containing protein 1b-like [Marmota monax]|nr:disintegrin and metalloproteinase domain-containing protein 1b-like [Marmota monax]